MKKLLTALLTILVLNSSAQTRNFSAYDTAGNYYFKSIDSLQRKIITQPKNAILYYNRSNLILQFLYKQRSKYTINDALADINKAIAIKSDTAEFYVHRSKCYEYFESILDSMKLGIQDMTKAIALVPNNAAYYKRRAVLNITIEADESIICSDIRKAYELGDTDVKDAYFKRCKQ